MAVPALVQHVSTAYLCFNGAGAGDDFTRYLSNKVQAGNGIIIGVSYQHGTSPTISDNNGNTWGAASETTDIGSATDGTQAGTSLFYLQSANAGYTQFKIHFGATVFVTDYFIAEFCNLGAFNNGVAAGNVTAPNLACGPFTPGNGNLVIAYYAPFATIAGSMTGWTPGVGFSLIHGDFSGTAANQRPHCAEYLVQSGAGSINPGVTASGSTDAFNCVAISINAASAGSPMPTSGQIWVPGIFNHTEFVAPGNPMVMKCPLLGTARVLFSGVAGSITGITDSASGSWTKLTSGVSIGEMWWSTGNAPNANLTINVAGGGQFTTRLLDIANVDNTSPPVTSTSQAGCGGVSSISNAPSIVPGVSSGAAFAYCPLGQGPVFSVTSPAGAIPDMGLYPPLESDTDTLDNADGIAHVSFSSNPGTINFNWTIFNAVSNNFGAVAISFKATPAQASGAAPSFGVLGFATSEW